MRTQVYIKDLRIHAFHGVMEQERTVGNDYIVNVTVDYPFEKTCLTDDVSDTLNYAILADIIRREMLIPSNLLEHVAQRIKDKIREAFPLTQNVCIDICKVAPPMLGDMAGAGVRISPN